MFAENDRISHRQLMRQIVLSLAAPFLLCLAGWQDVKGINGLVGIGVAMVLLGFYVIFLVRLGPAYEHLQKVLGKVQSVAVIAVYMIYVLFTAAYVLQLASSLASEWLLSGVREWYIRLAILLVCAVGSHQGMQKRARMAEVSYWIIVGSLVILIILAFVQGENFAAQEFLRGTFGAKRAVRGTYEILCGFLPLTLLPFLLSKVAKASSGGRAVFGAVGVLGVLLAAILILLPMALGWDRMSMEKIPVLPLMTGTNLPGDILARFDVIWISLLIYALLYSLGSLFYYGSHILQSVSLSVSHWILAAVVFVISCDPVSGFSISKYYGKMLMNFGAPVLFILTVYIYIWYRRKGS